MKLYWCPQTRSMRALWMMEEAGVPYERVLIDIRAGKQSTPEYHAINPMEKVPALSDGEAKLAECAAICAYVAERCPEAKLAPPLGDPRRGRYLHWLFFAAANIEAAYTEKFGNLQIPSQQAGWGSFDRVFDVIDEAVTPGPWLLGDQFTAADVMIGSDLFYATTLLKLLAPKPASAAYIKRCMERPAFKRAVELNAGPQNAAGA